MPRHADPSGDGANPAPTVSGRDGRAVAWRLLTILAALALVAMTWAFTLFSVRIERQEATLRAEGSVNNLALAVEWQLNRQLQGVDHILMGLVEEWKSDPLHFDPGAWRRRAALPRETVGEGALQVHLLDAQGAVMASTQPDMQRQSLADRDFFLAQRGPGPKGLFIGPAIRWTATGRWEINLSRRLERNEGSFAGVVVITYDPWVLTGLLEQVDVGPHGLISLVGGDGVIRALVSPGAVSPGEDIRSTEMFRQMQRSPQGVWTGPSAPDRRVRLHAFRKLRDLDLTVVVGAAEDEAMSSAEVWQTTAQLFAAGISVLVLGMAALLLRLMRQGREREQRLDRDRAVLEQAYTALEQAHAGTEAKASQIAAMLAGMSDGVMMLDGELRLVQWNDRFACSTGVPPENLRIGVPMADLLRAQARAGEFGRVDVEEEVSRRIAQLHVARHPGQPATVVMERIRPDGSTLELRRSVLPDGGFVTLYTDITARKRAEEAERHARRIAEEAAEQKSRFVAIVSHEIRTPLNAVVNSLALLDRSGLSPAQRRLAETASQAGDALMELVHDILELSKMEAGQLTVRPTVFALRPVLDGVVEMFRAQAAERGIRLLVELAADIPEQLRTDGGRLRQVLMNFVSNATKFSRPGDVVLRAEATLLAGRTCLLVSVSDQGPRIPQAQASQLFQPFSRLDNARQQGTPGTGLGLAICERLTRLLGGQIGLDTAISGGNRFWVAIPLEGATQMRRPTIAPVILLPRRRRATVLLVEDIAASHLVTSTILRREGHRVDVAESGPEAIRLAAQRPYDMVFMDLMMPGMNGYEATRRIRALPGPASTVPIVALTANTAAEDRDRCRAAGMTDMLGKPVRAEEMLEALNRAVWSMAARELPGAEVARPPTVMPAAPLPALDATRLAELERGLPVATMQALLDECLSDMRRRVQRLGVVLGQGGAREIEEITHAVAGLATTYGMAAMEARMRRIMLAARRGDLSGAVAASEGMEADLAAATEAVRCYVSDKAEARSVVSAG